MPPHSPRPKLGTVAEENALIGSVVVFKWDGDPLPSTQFGWYRGKVTKRASEADRKKHEGVNMLVKFSNNETNCVLPGCLGGKCSRRSRF